MCTTLHLLLGNKHYHELPGRYITRAHMLALQRAQLEWLLVSIPPTMWSVGCLHQEVHPPQLAHTGPYTRRIIAATISVSKGNSWRPTRISPRGPIPDSVLGIPSGRTQPHTAPIQASLLPAPTGRSMVDTPTTTAKLHSCMLDTIPNREPKCGPTHLEMGPSGTPSRSGKPYLSDPGSTSSSDRAPRCQHSLTSTHL